MDKLAVGFFAIVTCLIIAVLVQPEITGLAIYGKYTDTMSLSKYQLEEEILEAEEIVEEEVEDVEEYQFNPDLYTKYDLGKYKLPPIEEDESEDEPDASCCIDPEAVDALIDKVEELEEKVNEMEERQNQQCTPITITRGSCEETCQQENLRCTASFQRREVTDEGLFSTTTTELFSVLDDCDDDWYFPNDPNVKDTRTCVCC